MLSAEMVHAEGDRYAAALVCIPGLWAGTQVWRGFASYLAHRGWDCHLLDVRAVGPGVAARARAVADHVAGLGMPAILVGHDAGALVALVAATRSPAAALVLLAPLDPGASSLRRLVRAPRSMFALVLGRPVPPPRSDGAAAWADLPAPLHAAVLRDLAPEPAGAVRDVVWGRVPIVPPGAPTLLVAGAHDALLPAARADALARGACAELRVLDGAGHWLLAGPAWQSAVAVVHRWLVKRLGEPLLELHAEAMAERDEDDEGSA
jgi:pimeloyl-ACP methyl ester carboxylesterase